MSKNVIYFGVPGTGKSFEINKNTKKKSKLVTTFHPEYDYFDFVGTYRPLSEEILENKKFIGINSKDSLVEHNYHINNNKLNYKFVPRVFLRAYVQAWKNLNEPSYLVIEEINRGNCSAIFGDIFQLLDRDEEGFSEYFIDANAEVRNYLFNQLAGTDYEVRISDLYFLKNESHLDDPYSVLLIPNNLFIYATMNTSDQSLYPMDSAFKRRWEWEYIPIDYNDSSLTDKVIIIGNKKYSWLSFLENVNQFIYEVTETEDKCLGPFFVKSKEITLNEFRNKVLFYLWNEILKNETVHTRLRVLPTKILNGEITEFTIDYNDFYNPTHHLTYLKEVLEKLNVEVVEEEGTEEVVAEETPENDGEDSIAESDGETLNGESIDEQEEGQEGEE